MKKNIFKFISLFFIIIFVSGCANKNTKVFKEPLYKNPDSSYEGFIIDYLFDFVTEQYYTMDNISSSLHTSAIFSALNDERHGEIYYWENKKYFGRVKIVLTYFLESDLVCRHWVEQVSKIKREYTDGTIKHTKKDGTNKACYNKKEDKWYFENYYGE